ncbi:MAG: hypothetical protein E5W55_02905 [Mesorhizobium sp.]|nr:MAG: hypothetical protein E5W55_02905 [Mesorhizobium sp.]
MIRDNSNRANPGIPKFGYVPRGNYLEQHNLVLRYLIGRAWLNVIHARASWLGDFQSEQSIMPGLVQ